MEVRWWCPSLPLKLHSDLSQWWTLTYNRWRRFISKTIRRQIATAPETRKNRHAALTSSLINKSNSSSSSLRRGFLSKTSCSTDLWPPTTMPVKILHPRHPLAQIPYWILVSCLNNKIRQRSPLVLSRRLPAKIWEWAAATVTLKYSRWLHLTTKIISARWIPIILIIRSQPSAWQVLGPTDLCLCKNPPNFEDHENQITEVNSLYNIKNRLRIQWEPKKLIYEQRWP